MKKYILLLFLLAPGLAVAQTKVITGIVKDNATNKPIEGISISIPGTNQRTLTNDDGEFKVSVPSRYSNLNFYHLAYDEKDFQVNRNAKVEILMTPKVYQLEEVGFSKESGKDSLVKAVNNSKKKLEKSFLFNTYYREFAKVNDEYTAFADGMLDYHTYKKTIGNKSEQRAINVSDLYVKQSRVLGLSDNNVPDNDWKLNLSLFGFQDVKRVVLDAYDFGIIKRILDNSQEYTFKVENKEDKDGNRIKVIKINPKKNIDSDYMYIGSVTYDEKSNLILMIDLKFSPEHKKYAKILSFWYRYDIKVRMNEDSRKAVFKVDGDNYVILYDERRSNAYINVKKKFVGNMERIYYINTVDYQEGEFDLAGQKKYDGRSLILYGNKYNEEFWRNRNVVPLSDREEEILRMLGQKGSFLESAMTTVPPSR